MIDLTSETPIPLAQIPNRFPHLGRNGGRASGKRLCFSTVWRWVSKGVLWPGGGRVKLEALKLGGQLVTTEQSLQRFAEALTPRDADEPPAKRQRASERAAAELARCGI